MARAAIEGEERTEVLRRFAELLLDDPNWLPELATSITDAIHSEMPELDADSELRRGTYASSESILRNFVDLVFAGQGPEEAEMPPAAVEYAREFVRRGLPIDSLLRTYRVGHATFFQTWIEQLRRVVADPVELTVGIEAAAGWSFTYIDTLSRGLIQRYEHERDRWVRSAAALRIELTERIIEGEVADLAAAEAQLGYRLARPHLAFVVWAEGSDGAGRDLGAIERVATEIGDVHAAGQPLIVPFGTDLVAGWIGGTELPTAAELEAVPIASAADAGLQVAFGMRAPGIEGFRRSHRQAGHARQVAQLQGASPGSVTAYERVALTALASADLEHARAFVAAELGPLAADDEGARRLAATLMVYLEERSSPRRAAQRLGVHENTIPNRIRAAQALLDRPIEGRAPELLVALRLRSAIDPAGEPGYGPR